MKFKTRPRFVDAVRITDAELAGPEAIGSWLVFGGNTQRTVSNEDFLRDYSPAGRGDAKDAYEQAKKDAGIEDPPKPAAKQPDAK